MTPQDPTAQDKPVSDQPTAETDAAIFKVVLCGGTATRAVVSPDFARTLERQRDAARAELERVKADFEFIRNNRDRLKIVLVEAGKDADRLRADLAAAKSKAAQYRADFEMAAAKADGFQKEGIKMRADRDDLHARLMRWQTAANGWRIELRQARARVESLAEENEELTARAVEAERAREMLRAALKGLAKAARRLMRFGVLWETFETRKRKVKEALAISDAALTARVAGLPGDGESQPAIERAGAPVDGKQEA